MVDNLSGDYVMIKTLVGRNLKTHKPSIIKPEAKKHAASVIMQVNPDHIP